MNTEAVTVYKEKPTFKIIGFLALGVLLFYIYGFNMLFISQWSLAYLLLCLTMEDMATHYISSDRILLHGFLGIVFLWLNPNIPWLMTLVSSLGVGLVFYIISKATKGALGLGDVQVILVVFLYRGLIDGGLALLYAFILSGIVGLGIMTFKRVNRKAEMPFLPFMFLGVMLEVLL